MITLKRTFITSLVIFIILYILRGLGIFSFLSGGIILILLLITISSGLAWAIKKTLRY
ncbi:MAG: hypothetical protein QNJ32_06930 [Xenococcaceae cyanobacterium MO_167.B27]|nr:hypothetical protein [Xenococcaceae cyanobacterium MO_167.B27]